MKVLHVINSLSGSGGAEQGLVREITRFQSDIEQMVVRLYQPDDLESRLRSARIESSCLNLNSGNSAWNWPGGVMRLSQVISSFAPDVVHTSLASSNLIGQIAAGRARIPVLSTFTLSGDPALMRRYQPGADTRRAQIMRKIERWSARGQHVWFRALTTDAKKTNVEVVGLDPNRVDVIPRGVPIPDLSAPIPNRTELQLPGDVPLILNVGRQTAQKGHADLVRAFAAVRLGSGAHLVILGREGDGTQTLESSIESEGVAPDVSVFPYTGRPYAYYRSADVFVFSSFMEGLGTAVLEAMACGVPVAAYDIPPVREISSDGRFARLVPNGDIDALADAISDILGSPSAAREMALAAREHVEANYSLDGVSRRLEALLRDLAKLSPRESPDG